MTDKIIQMGLNGEHKDKFSITDFKENYGR